MQRKRARNSARRNLQQQLTAIALAEEAEKETGRLQRQITEEQKKLGEIAAKVATQTRILEGNAAKIAEQEVLFQAKLRASAVFDDLYDSFRKRR